MIIQERFPIDGFREFRQSEIPPFPSHSNTT